MSAQTISPPMRPYVIDKPKPPTAERPITTDDDSSLDMPESCMYGWLGEKARSLDAPLGWAYMSVITLWTGKQDGPCDLNQYETLPPNLFTILVASPNAGKTRVVRRAIKVLGEDYLEETNISSDRGLINLFVDDGPPGPIKHATVFQDEATALIKKMAIPNSTLTSTFNGAYYGPRLSAVDKKGKQKANAWMSYLGGLAIKDPSEFPFLFGPHTADGFIDRLILVPGPSDYSFNHDWSFQFEEERKRTMVEIPAVVHARFQAWSLENKDDPEGVNRRRLQEIALRVAALSASANQNSSVNEACADAAMEFAKWQERVRKIYQHGHAETTEAQITTAIVHKVKTIRSKDGKPLKFRWRSIARTTNWATRWGSPAVTRTRDSMVGTYIDAYRDDQGKPTGWYIWLDPTSAEQDEKDSAALDADFERQIELLDAERAEDEAEHQQKMENLRSKKAAREAKRQAEAVSLEDGVL